MFTPTSISSKCDGRQANVDMPYQRISALDKQRLFDAHMRGEDYQELARQIGIKRTTAWAIINRAQRRNGEVAVRRGGRRPNCVLVNDTMTETSVRIVEERPEFTLNQIIRELHVRLPDEPRISTTTLSRILNAQLIFMKNLEDAPSERNTTTTKDRRKEFAQWLMEDGIHTELIFIDEAGINLWMRRSRGRARRGERAVRVVGGRRSGNFTMVFAVSHTRGLIHHDLFQGGMTAARFITFLESLPFVGGERSVTLIFDNASAHRRASEATLPAHVSLRWQPAYSPFLNIVENCFSQWKSAMKRQLSEVREQTLTQGHEQRLATLAQIAEQSISVVTADNAQSYFRHLQRYLPACLLCEDILM